MAHAHLLESIEEARRLIEGARAVTVLTGAGISTDSGIPDFRGPNGLWTRNPDAEKASDIRYYVSDPEVRKRNWAARVAGEIWVDRDPNDGHRALVRLEQQGKLHALITQNVDGLHQKAGSHEVVELHGSLREARCLSCGTVEPRQALQERLAALNPGFVGTAPRYAPDGDADVPDDLVAAFQVAACTVCGGVLKPQVVFFGENVPRDVYEAAREMVDAGASLLVVGSSLTVRSGYRFVGQAKEAGKPVALLNDGPTRADGEVDVKVEGRLGELLPALAGELLGTPG